MEEERNCDSRSMAIWLFDRRIQNSNGFVPKTGKSRMRLLDWFTSEQNVPLAVVRKSLKTRRMAVLSHYMGKPNLVQRNISSLTCIFQLSYVAFTRIMCRTEQIHASVADLTDKYQSDWERASKREMARKRMCACESKNQQQQQQKQK